MAWLDFIDTPLLGLRVMQRQLRHDNRGFFSRFFCISELAAHGIDFPVVQMNHTLTRKRGAVRGMHFQKTPYAEDKIVGCMRGAIFDVVVDVRQDSPTFLRWHGEELSAENCRSLLIPKGFAHGFQALTEDAELLYLHSVAYEPAAEGALNINDPRIGVRWPLPLEDMSERDKGHPYINAGFTGLRL